MRTSQEILNRVREEESPAKNDVLLPFLSYDDAETMIHGALTRKEWEENIQLSQTRETVLEDLESYLFFAWDKVRKHRAGSVRYGVEKMVNYLWLLEDDELQGFALNLANFGQMGAPILSAICHKYGFEMPDDPKTLNMIQGKPCEENCEYCTSDS